VKSLILQGMGQLVNRYRQLQLFRHRIEHNKKLLIGVVVASYLLHVCLNDPMNILVVVGHEPNRSIHELFHLQGVSRKLLGYHLLEESLYLGTAPNDARHLPLGR
jgi:hypothetical protein